MECSTIMAQGTQYYVQHKVWVQCAGVYSGESDMKGSWPGEVEQKHHYCCHLWIATVVQCTEMATVLKG
jgi:hypothetical protein